MTRDQREHSTTEALMQQMPRGTERPAFIGTWKLNDIAEVK
jgi:hypothetical protein